MSKSSCYQHLSSYTKNGLSPIQVPVPSETKPQLFNEIVPHAFVQTNYDQMSALKSNYQNSKSCDGYIKLSSLPCTSSGGSPDSSSAINSKWY